MLVTVIAPLWAKGDDKGSLLEAVQKQLWATRSISQIQLSPDNKNLLLVYSFPREFVSEGKKMSEWATKIVIRNHYASEKSHDVEFSSEEKIFSPDWTRDSQGVSYLSKGDKFISLWVSPPHAFKSRKILEGEDDIVEYKWSVNGKKLAVLVKVPIPQDPLKVVVSTGDLQFYKLYVADVANNVSDNVTDNMSVSSPTLLASSLLFTGNRTGEFSWSPDNQHIVISHRPLVKGEPSEFLHISLISLKDKTFKTIEKGERMYFSPLVSPNGQFVAYTTNDLPENAQNPMRFYGMTASRVCVTDLKSYGRQCLAPTPNEFPSIVGWTQDSQTLLVTDQEGNADHIYELGIDGKAFRRLTQGSFLLGSVFLNPPGNFVSYAATDLKTPSEGYVTPVAPFQPKKVISSSEAFLKDDFRAETVHWKSKDNKFTLEGLLISPNAKGPLPLITILYDYFSTIPALDYVGNLNKSPLAYAALLERATPSLFLTEEAAMDMASSLGKPSSKSSGRGITMT